MVNVTNFEAMFGRLIDSYPLSNRDDSVVLNAVNEAVGQSFTSPLTQAQLTDAIFYLQRNAAFGVGGNILRAELYRAQGVVGTTATPVGAVLATSDNVLGTDAMLQEAWNLVNFNFGTPFMLEPAQDYVIVITVFAYIAGQVEVGTDTSAPGYTGNECDRLAPPAWVANAGTDCIFYLFSYSDVLAAGAVDVIDRAARLVGIVYGEADQLQQLTPVDAMAPNLSLEALSFLAVYDAVAGDWNRAREGIAIGSLLTDPADRAARLVGIVYGDLGQLNQTTPVDATTPTNSLETAAFPHVYDPIGGDWNMLREGAVAGQLLADVADRAARNVGIVYGDQAQLQQNVGTLELITEDTGTNTNPERWLNDNHWNPAAEITIAVAGAPGEQPLGAAVGAGVTRRIREVTIRHAGTNNTVVTILDQTAGNILVSIDVPAQSTRSWSSQDGRLVAATLQPVIQTSDIAGGSTFVSAAGVEA